MPPRQDDAVDWHPVDRPAARRGPVSGGRKLILAGGFGLAIAATVAVFLTENAQYLRIAVVAVAWAFVLATFAAGRRQADRVAAAAREEELHRAYEYELAREVAARREYELELENDIRRETEDAMRAELDALRDDIAGLASLRDDLDRVAQLRGDLRALAELRDDVARVAALGDDVARVAALRDDVAALAALRGELGQLSELRADMGRLRAELVEQLASEMHVERITMRTQSSRLPADQGRGDALPGRTVEASPAWSDGAPPRELTGGWPAARLDEPRETRQFEQVRPREDVWDAAPPPTTSWPATPPPWSAEPVPATAASPLAPPPEPPADSWSAENWASDRWSPSEPGHVDRPSPWPSRPSAAEPPSYAPPTSMQQPIEWLAARSLLDARSPSPRPPVPPSPQPPLAPPTAAYPAVAPTSGSSPTDRPGGTTGSLRVSEILAENGMNPATGGRRRRRYRDEDTSDDVLSRVLGRN
jgi:hypothetical protein